MVMVAPRQAPAQPHRPVVTVAAQHGAAGRLVAPRVAEALGVPFLDRALPKSLADASVESERANGFLGSLARASTMLAGEAVERTDLNEGHMRAELAEFLTRTSTDGGVVLGRGGVVVLADVPTALHVLLAGDRQGRVARVAEDEGIDRAEADRRVRAHDRARRDYMRRAFGVDPENLALYHLIVDTVALGVNVAVELVVTASRARIRHPSAEK
jgi:cytidylate kinase